MGSRHRCSGVGLLLLTLALGAQGCQTPRKGLSAGGCDRSQDYSGSSLPYHTIPIDNGNDFNTGREAFRTSTDAQSGYTAYATWDPCALYLGYTGSAIGSGDCTDLSQPTCTVAGLPESPDRFLLYYLNTDPLGSRGTENAKSYGGQEWTLPFKADYLLAIRTDGESTPKGDSVVYVGNWHLYESREGEWTRVKEARVEIGDNSSSNFIELLLPLKELGSPCAVEVLGWVVDTRHDTSFAYWPARNGESGGSMGGPSGGPGGDSATARKGGRSGGDSASARQGTRSGSDSASAAKGRRAPGDSARSGGSAGARDSTSRGPSGGAASGLRENGGSATGPGRRRLRSYYGFELRDKVAPNQSANLDRT
ncbi:MAG TPA: hypothetical protein VGR37_02705, partial [Longimicrobiaceae bacterium]|nr:hypothetical protein [Longimicrobiaceae bacterium]